MKLRKLFTTGLLASCCLTQAQQFTQLDWSVLRLDSILPHYTEVIPLDENYAAYHYQVQLIYPEFQKLTAQETAGIPEDVLQSLPEMPLVETHIGVSRRQGFLDLNFIPVVKRNGSYYKMTGCRIDIHKKPKIQLATRQTENANTRNERQGSEGTPGKRTERYARRSVLAEGKWHKIRVKQNGVYALTAADLKKMGFNDISKVKVYGYGGALQNEALDADKDYDDLQEIPTYPGQDGLLFYARGPVSRNASDPYRHIVNPYASYGYYFLTEGDNPLRFETESYDGYTAKTYQDFLDLAIYEEDAFAWYHGGRKLFDSYDHFYGNSKTYYLSTPGALAGHQATLLLAFTAGNNLSTTVKPSCNNKNLGSFNLSATSTYISATSAEKRYDITMTDEEKTAVKIETTAGRHARMDFMTLAYKRKLELTEPFLIFQGEKKEPATFQLANPQGRTVKIWRAGTAEKPFKEIPCQEKNGKLTASVADAADTYIAVDVNGTFPKPESAGSITAQNLHAIDSLIDMVIIVPESGKLTEQANRLAEAHKRLDNLHVLVVRADQIYNEFSSGTPDATAYRRFMKMLYDRAATPEEAPRYLLLFGDCAWDNRMLSSAWKGKDPKDYLLCFESENSFSDIKCFVMEDYFGLLDDGEGKKLTREKVDLGIGRFPVTTEEEARLLVDKTIHYMENKDAGMWKNTITFLGDDGDNNLHMNGADQVARDMEARHPQYDYQKIYWDAFQRKTSTTGDSYPEVEEKIKKQMKEGALIMNYTGHANTYSFSHELALQIQDFQKFTSTKTPLWITAACDVMPFDGSVENIGETAILNPTAAAVAFYGTTRTVYADDNLYMHRYFNRYILDKDAKGRRYRLGDAVRMAKVSLLDPNGGYGNDHTENKLHYALLGDPALQIGQAIYQVRLDSINGQTVKDQAQMPSLAAGSMTRISGRIVDESGNEVPDFEGKLDLKVYDTKSHITCHNNAGANSPFQFDARDKILYAGSDSVKAGKFSMTFPIPLDINYADQSGRMVFYAINQDKRKEANGYNEQFLVGGTSTDLAQDTIGPEIQVRLNGQEEIQGARFNCSPMFTAILKDISGINTTGNGVGHELELVIDDDPRQTYHLNEYYVHEFGDYTQGSVSFILPTLTAGKHRLRFRAWDGMNNPSTVEYEFEVDPGIAPQLIRVNCSQNPARTTTNFIIYYDRPGEMCSFNLEVMDFAGRVLWKHTEKGNSENGFYTVPWNLTAGGGARLGTGVYLYRATVVSESGARSASETQKIIIIGNK